MRPLARSRPRGCRWRVRTTGPESRRGRGVGPAGTSTPIIPPGMESGTSTAAAGRTAGDGLRAIYPVPTSRSDSYHPFSHAGHTRRLLGEDDPDCGSSPGEHGYDPANSSGSVDTPLSLCRSSSPQPEYMDTPPDSSPVKRTVCESGECGRSIKIPVAACRAIELSED